MSALGYSDRDRLLVQKGKIKRQLANSNDDDEKHVLRMELLGIQHRLQFSLFDKHGNFMEQSSTL